jgi:hypothetical protein
VCESAEPLGELRQQGLSRDPLSWFLRSGRDIWQATKEPLERQLDERSRSTKARKAAAERKLAAIKRMRGEMRDMLGAARAREAQYKALLVEYEGASHAVQRSTFVHRIMEIVKNLKHQEADIRSIIADTREVQRDINTSTQVISRHIHTRAGLRVTNWHSYP